MKSEARKKLENYFGQRRELIAKHKAGLVGSMHYKLRYAHQEKILMEQSWRGFICLREATDLINRKVALSQAEHDRYKVLSEKDYPTLLTWYANYFERNIEAATYRVLELIESVEAVPIPDPTPEAVARHEAARMHQIGVAGPDVEVAVGRGGSGASACGNGGNGAGFASAGGCFIGGGGGGGSGGGDPEGLGNGSTRHCLSAKDWARHLGGSAST